MKWEPQKRGQSFFIFYLNCQLPKTTADGAEQPLQIKQMEEPTTTFDSQQLKCELENKELEGKVGSSTSEDEGVGKTAVEATTGGGEGDRSRQQQDPASTTQIGPQYGMEVAVWRGGVIRP